MKINFLLFFIFNIRKNYEQTRILNDIEESIRMFDENVAYYAELRITLDVHVKYLELFLLTLHQELMILKVCTTFLYN